MISLNGRWELSDESGDYRCGIELPGDVVSALHDAGLIPDPYWGRNEYDLRWICERDWFLRREVELEEADGILEISGLDTVGSVSWNGQVVIEGRNVHRRYRQHLNSAARVGKNEVEIRLRSPVEAGREAHAALPFPVPWHAENNPIPYGNALRKTQCDFGWDWNIALAPVGVVGDITLEPVQPARIAGLHVQQDHRGDGGVNLWVGVDVETSADAKLRLEFDGEVQELDVLKDDGQKRFLQLFEIADPDLWWPAGQGAQVLHDLTVTLGGQVERRRIGLRKIELITEPDREGSSFGFRVNGRDVFAKGANWIPADALAGRIDRAAVRDLLQSAVDANMNMIRVWGGGRYEPDWFYDLCDEMGLMVWQDFMFACSLYPSTEEFLAEVDGEVRDVVARLQHHASIVVWCGDNELVGALNWFPESRDNRDRYLVSYDRLNRTIERALKETDPRAIWWPSSPSLGLLDFGDGWHDAPSGDMHFWSVWHENRDFEHYRDVRPRFCSEFGFQSYPSMDVIRKFAGPDDLNAAAPVMESHQKNRGGNERIAATMFRYFRQPQTFSDFVYLSQVQQGLAIRTAVDYWRSLKPHCRGTLYWQLNDTWPVCSWSSLDHGGGWKLLHHMARDFFAPVRVVAVPEGEGIRLVGLNDTGSDLAVTLEFRAMDLGGGMRPLGGHEKTIPSDRASELARVAPTDLAAGEVLAFDWRWGSDGEAWDLYAPVAFKSLDLQPPGLSATWKRAGDAWEVALNAERPAFFVAPAADCAGRFDRAGFSMIPGREERIRFTPQGAPASPAFTFRDLHSATYGAK